jgi:hypothetical protein
VNVCVCVFVVTITGARRNVVGGATLDEELARALERAHRPVPFLRRGLDVSTLHPSCARFAQMVRVCGCVSVCAWLGRVSRGLARCRAVSSRLVSSRLVLCVCVTSSADVCMCVTLLTVYLAANDQSVIREVKEACCRVSDGPVDPA